VHLDPSRLSLRSKLVALTFLVVVGTSGILVLELPRAMDRQSRDWIESRSLGLSRLLASAVEAAIDFDDPGAAQRALDGLARTRGAAYALLLREGTRFARWSQGSGAAAPPPGVGGAEEGAEVAGGLLHVRLPWTTRAGRQATLLLGFTLDEMEERRAEARASIFRAGMVALLAGLAAAVALGTLLSRPLRLVTAAARGVAEGDEAAAQGLPVERKDEIGGLALAFTRMLERLWEQREQIRTINTDLARRVQERTQDLARTHAALDELARTQQQLVLADRRVSVGRLAAGVAHEVNNPLTFLRGNLDFVAKEIPALQAALRKGNRDEVDAAIADMAGALADARQGAQRVTQIVRGLKTFARDDEDKRQVLTLREPLEAAIEMALHEIKHRARLVRAFEPTPLVVANEVRLSQVFLNLLLNAAQAVPEGGKEQHEIRAWVGTDARGRAAAAVSDTGCGMSEEVRSRIFDPFFTTKGVGEGSGLGLSISRNIVEGLGGEISVESEPGKGAVFRVSLPAAPPEAAEAASGEAEGAGEHGEVSLAGLRVLVVDDEPLVGTTVSRALADCEIAVAAGGAEALERVRRGESWDWILCDVMMPAMSGPDLYLELARVAPHLQRRLIFMTGGAFSEGAVGFLEGWSGPVVHKPFDTPALRRLLHVPLA